MQLDSPSELLTLSGRPKMKPGEDQILMFVNIAVKFQPEARDPSGTKVASAQASGIYRKENRLPAPRPDCRSHAG